MVDQGCAGTDPIDEQLGQIHSILFGLENHRIKT